MRVKVLKPTQDNWHGSYVLEDWYNGVQKQMFVKVIFNGNITANDKTQRPIWHTCVWGNDDCGMEFYCSDEATAWNMFLQVIGLEFVNKDLLKTMGFHST